MAETVVAEAVPVAKCLLKKIWQELSYVFCYKSYIEDLKEPVQKLSHERERIKQEVKSKKDALWTIYDEVTDWLDKADGKITEHETSFNEKTVAVKAACCGRLPNLKGRFYLGRNAKKMADNVKEFLGSEPKIIAQPALPPKVEFLPTAESSQLGTNFHEGASSSGTSNHEHPPDALLNFDSRGSTIEDVMEALRGDQINPIIICGLGGMGKTTLMGQVHEKAEKEGLFLEYTRATVNGSLAKPADVIDIQGELAEYLCKGLLQDEKASGPRASKLRQRLSLHSKKKTKKKNILVMLDDVWKTTPNFLRDIGIPCDECTLLVTSRQKDLFKHMDTSKDIPIHALSDRDAWSLFVKTAGSCIQSDPKLRVEAEKVLKKCAGLPSAISTVGRALKGRSIDIWGDALVQLQNACPEIVDGVIERVYEPIMFSHESLSSKEAKSFFWLCCVGSADTEDLIKYGLGLGLFKHTDTIEQGRKRVKTLVQILKRRFLLLDVDGEPEPIRMHDVVRDVAFYIASEESVRKKDDPVEKRIVVSDTGKTLKLMEDWSISEQSAVCRSLIIGSRCELLHMEFGSGSGLKPSHSHTIFKKVEDLKALTIIGQPESFFHKLPLQSLVPSLAVLRNLQTLRLEWCDLGCDVSVIGELTTLRMLSLRGSDIKELPDTFKNLFDLRLLDLRNCWKLKVISEDVITNLNKLEELKTDSNDRGSLVPVKTKVLLSLLSG